MGIEGSGLGALAVVEVAGLGRGRGALTMVAAAAGGGGEEGGEGGTADELGKKVGTKQRDSKATNSWYD